MKPMTEHNEQATMESAPTSAADVVRAVVTALQDERWADVVPFLRPGALREYQHAQVRWMVAMEQRAPRSPDELRQEQPWLPPEVAAFYADQERAHVTGALPALREQWGVASLRELEALSPAEFFARHLSAFTPAARMRATLAASHHPPVDPEAVLRAAEGGHRRSWTVLGEVTEGADTAHVVYRQREGGSESGEVRVTTLYRADGRWWMRIAPPLLDHGGWSRGWAPASGEPGGTDG